MPVIAEDLGVITPDVVHLREAISAPGMVVLQFAWGAGPTNVHLPHNHYENSVCYPGVGMPGKGSCGMCQCSASDGCLRMTHVHLPLVSSRCAGCCLCLSCQELNWLVIWGDFLGFTQGHVL